MPELPEVETIKRGLEKKIIGLKLEKVELRDIKVTQKEIKPIEGQKVLKVWRRAKILGINLGCSKQWAVDRGQIKHNCTLHPKTCNLTILFHLKMTGQLVLVTNDKRPTTKDKRLIGGHPTKDMVGPMPNKYTRAIFYFEGGSTLYFNDLRKFGWIKVITTTEVTTNQFFLGLGPEPLEKEFTFEVFKNNLLKHKNLAVKVAILDQKVVAGVGNIYACEALFHAKIHPITKVSELTNPQIKKLFEGIIFALNEGVNAGGSTRQHFVNIDGARGYFLDNAFVYGREGKNCRVCGSKISKLKVGARGTYLCLKCQLI